MTVNEVASRSGLSALTAQILPIALAAYVQYPTTRGCFRGDDVLNLYQLNNYGLFQYLITPHLGHVLVARNVVFYLSWLLFGANATPYMWSAFLTHLLNVWLLFLVIDAFTRSRAAALFGAALWGACPLHADALGFYAVYGQVLVGTVILLILLQVGWAAPASTPPNTGAARTWYGLAIIAVLCFGSGIAFAMLLPFILALLLPQWRPHWRWRVPLLSLVVVVPALYFGVYVLYELIFAPRVTAGLFFTIVPRGVTAAPVGVFRLLSLGVFRLLLGPSLAPAAFWVAYALLAALLVAMAIYLWRASAPARRLAAACILLAVSCYGAVAITRVFRVYDQPAAAMDLDGRFHYVALIPVAILLSLLWQPMSVKLPRVSAFLIGSWCALTVTASVLAGEAADGCVRSRQEIAEALASIRAAIEHSPSGATVAIPNRVLLKLPMAPMHTVFPGWAALFTLHYPDNVVAGRRVVFVDPDAQVIEAAQHGRRSRTLLVPAPHP